MCYCPRAVSLRTSFRGLFPARRAFSKQVRWLRSHDRARETSSPRRQLWFILKQTPKHHRTVSDTPDRPSLRSTLFSKAPTAHTLSVISLGTGRSLGRRRQTRRQPRARQRRRQLRARPCRHNQSADTVQLRERPRGQRHRRNDTESAHDGVADQGADCGHNPLTRLRRRPSQRPHWRHRHNQGTVSMHDSMHDFDADQGIYGIADN